jgi:hypothetical protein
MNVGSVDTVQTADVNISVRPLKDWDACMIWFYSISQLISGKKQILNVFCMVRFGRNDSQRLEMLHDDQDMIIKDLPVPSNHKWNKKTSSTNKCAVKLILGLGRSG